MIALIKSPAMTTILFVIKMKNVARFTVERKSEMPLRAIPQMASLLLKETYLQSEYFGSVSDCFAHQNTFACNRECVAKRQHHKM